MNLTFYESYCGSQSHIHASLYFVRLMWDSKILRYFIVHCEGQLVLPSSLRDLKEVLYPQFKRRRTYSLFYWEEYVMHMVGSG